MRFGEKLKMLRKQAKMTQEELSKKLGITTRSLQNYECGKQYPRDTALYGTLTQIFSVSADYLLTDEDRYILAAEKQGGSEGKRDVSALLNDVGGLFAGGELSEDDKDKVMKTINDLYWEAKERNKKYGKSHRRSQPNE